MQGEGKDPKHTKDADDELRKFIIELNTPQFHLKKCSEERILSTFGFLQLVFNDFSLKNCGRHNSSCEVCRHLEDRMCDCKFEKFKNHHRSMKNVCNF